MKGQFDLPGIGQGTRKFPLTPFLPRRPGDATRFPAGRERIANAGRRPERRELFRQASLGQGAIDQNPAQFLQPAAGPEIDEESVVCGRIGRLVHVAVRIRSCRVQPKRNPFPPEPLKGRTRSDSFLRGKNR